MKKLFLFALLAFTVSASANYLRKGRTEPILGYSTVDKGDGTFSIKVNFNTSLNIGDYFSENNCKAFQSVMIADENTSGYYCPQINSKLTERAGASARGYVHQNLEGLLDFSTVDSLKAYDPAQQFWKATAGIGMLNDTDGVWINYPGMFHRSLWGFRIKVGELGVLLSDLSFEMMTYDKGNTGKTATYKLLVDGTGRISNGFSSSPLKTAEAMDTLTAANVQGLRDYFGNNDVWCVDDIYTTSSDETMNKVTINVAELCGLAVPKGSADYLFVMVYTSGTGAEFLPGSIDPVIAFDNVNIDFAPASWTFPADVVDGTAISYNNGNPVVQAATNLYDAGEGVSVPAGQPLKLYLSSALRGTAITLTEDNLDKVHNPKFSVAGIKTKDTNGDYTVDVAFTDNPSDGSSVWSASIPLPESATTATNEDFEVSLDVSNLAVGDSTTLRIEITNGTRFWYDIKVIAAPYTEVPSQQANQLRIYDLNKSIIAKNATEIVVIYNTNGQILKSVSPNIASRGIAVPEGAYVVKTGDIVQKVIVK